LATWGVRQGAALCGQLEQVTTEKTHSKHYRQPEVDDLPSTTLEFTSDKQCIEDRAFPRDPRFKVPRRHMNNVLLNLRTSDGKPVPAPFNVARQPCMRRVRDEQSFVASDDGCSDRSDASSAPSKQTADEIFKVGYTPGGNGSLARLSDVLKMQSHRLKSLGSCHELHADCSPCSFHLHHVHTPSRPDCKASFMCEYCHDKSHHPKWRSAFRKNRAPPDLFANLRHLEKLDVELLDSKKC